MGNQALVAQKLAWAFQAPFPSVWNSKKELPSCLEEAMICNVHLHPHLGDGELGRLPTMGK